MLILKLEHPELICSILDIETSFLNTKLQENLYVELPSGYEIYEKISSLDRNTLDINDSSLIKSISNKNISMYNKYHKTKVCKLNSTLYGLVQEYREF